MEGPFLCPQADCAQRLALQTPHLPLGPLVRQPHSRPVSPQVTLFPCVWPRLWAASTLPAHGQGPATPVCGACDPGGRAPVPGGRWGVLRQPATPGHSASPAPPAWLWEGRGNARVSRMTHHRQPGLADSSLESMQWAPDAVCRATTARNWRGSACGPGHLPAHQQRVLPPNTSDAFITSRAQPWRPRWGKCQLEAGSLPLSRGCPDGGGGGKDLTF